MAPISPSEWTWWIQLQFNNLLSKLARNSLQCMLLLLYLMPGASGKLYLGDASLPEGINRVYAA